VAFFCLKAEAAEAVADLFELMVYPMHKNETRLYEERVWVRVMCVRKAIRRAEDDASDLQKIRNLVYQNAEDCAMITVLLAYLLVFEAVKEL
jgi:hypothetical protein